jgi:hypothetical protein
MQFYRCKCGKSRCWGSMPPSPCAKCKHCGSDFAQAPDAHREPLPHEFVPQMVQTDDGPKPLSRCRFCCLSQAEIDKREGTHRATPST